MYKTPPPNCEQLITTYSDVLVKSTKLVVAAYWVFFVLGLSYNNYNLLFTMKYWALSQKLESLIIHEKQISERRLRIISGIFWMIQAIMIASGVLLLIFAYKMEN